jgi:hypothetical protein
MARPQHGKAEAGGLPSTSTTKKRTGSMLQSRRNATRQIGNGATPRRWSTANHDEGRWRRYSGELAPGILERGQQWRRMPMVVDLQARGSTFPVVATK